MQKRDLILDVSDTIQQADKKSALVSDSPETPEPIHSKIFEVNEFQLKPILQEIEQSGSSKINESKSSIKQNNHFI